MKKYIDLDFLEKRAIKMHGFGDAKYISLRTAQAAPTVEMKPVIHAHWKKGLFDTYYCTNCKCPTDSMVTSYCPYCGAIMDEEKER